MFPLSAKPNRLYLEIKCTQTNLIPFQFSKKTEENRTNSMRRSRERNIYSRWSGNQVARGIRRKSNGKICKQRRLLNLAVSSSNYILRKRRELWNIIEVGCYIGEEMRLDGLSLYKKTMGVYASFLAFFNFSANTFFEIFCSSIRKALTILARTQVWHLDPP